MIDSTTETSYDELLDMQIGNINSLSRADVAVRELKNSGAFWQDKVTHMFGVDVALHKPVDETYREQYRFLYRSTLPMSIRQCRVDGIIHNIRKRKRHSGTLDAARLFNHCRGDTLIYLAEAGYIKDDDLLTPALTYGRTEFVAFLIEHGDIDLTPDDAFIAASNGHVDMLELIRDDADVLPPPGAADAAANHGHTYTLKWLYNEAGYLPTSRGADGAAKHGHVGTLEWLKNHGVKPTVAGANAAAGEGELKTLKWLAVENILPNQRGLNLAIKHDYLDVLRWYYDWTQQTPGHISLGKARAYGRHDIAEWIERAQA